MGALKRAATSRIANKRKNNNHLRDGDIEIFFSPVLHVMLEPYQRLFERGLLSDGVGIIDTVLVHVSRHVHHAHESSEFIVDAHKLTVEEAALCGIFPIDSRQNRPYIEQGREEGSASAVR